MTQRTLALAPLGITPLFSLAFLALECSGVLNRHNFLGM